MRKNTTKLRIVVIMLPAVLPASNFGDFKHLFSWFARSLTLGHFLHGPDFDVPFVQTIRWPDLVGQQLTAYFPWCRQREEGINTRVGTLIVATIYLQLIQNRYMFRSFTFLQCSHQHCLQSVASDVKS